MAGCAPSRRIRHQAQNWAQKKRRPAAPSGAAGLRRKLTDDDESLQLRGDRRKRCSQVGADRAEHSHGRNRDQSGDKAILDRRRPILVLQELGENRKHGGGILCWLLTYPSRRIKISNPLNAPALSPLLSP